MMSFKNDRLKKLDIPMNIVKLIGKINEYKGKQDLYIEQSPQILEKLQEVAVIKSTKASNSIEGIVITDKRLKEITKDDSVSQVRERIEYANNYAISKDQAKSILNYYNGLEKPEEGLYNYKNLPFSLLAEIQQEYHSVGWISTGHSGDYVELAMYGPHSENLRPFVRNTELHNFMLEAAEVADLV